MSHSLWNISWICSHGARISSETCPATPSSAPNDHRSSQMLPRRPCVDWKVAPQWAFRKPYKRMTTCLQTDCTWSRWWLKVLGIVGFGFQLRSDGATNTHCRDRRFSLWTLIRSWDLCKGLVLCRMPRITPSEFLLSSSFSVLSVMIWVFLPEQIQLSLFSTCFQTQPVYLYICSIYSWRFSSVSSSRLGSSTWLTVQQSSPTKWCFDLHSLRCR